MIAVLKDLKVVADDVLSAYIQSFAGELMHIIPGQEFRSCKETKSIIVKSLYGLIFSGEMWNQKLSDILRYLGFRPCYSEFDLWMQD